MIMSFISKHKKEQNLKNNQDKKLIILKADLENMFFPSAYK